MPTGVPKPEKNKDRLIFRQTKNGAYSSFPEIEDVLDEMGLAEKRDVLTFDYDDSAPDLRDVLYEMGLGDKKDEDWAESAQNSGHGAYVRNVHNAVEYCKAKGINTAEGVKEVLDKAESSTTWSQRASDRGHGEYIRNVQDAVKYCQDHGATTREDVEKLLKEAEIEEA